MLKPYSELRKIDVLEFCDHREAKDDDGKKISVPYLNWAKCKDLLHDNGAEVVYYEPLLNDKGHSLFMADATFTDSKGNINRCFEVRVKIVIDDLIFNQNYPLLNGVYVVRDDTINQLRLSNAQARAFVKGVAIRTGLGFGLWVKDDETTPPGDFDDDLRSHDIMKIRKRMLNLVTMKMDAGLSMDDMYEQLKISSDDWKYMISHYEKLNRLEKAVAAL